jgi:S1-C subfamily serine protease
MRYPRPSASTAQSPKQSAHGRLALYGTNGNAARFVIRMDRELRKGSTMTKQSIRAICTVLVLASVGIAVTGWLARSTVATAAPQRPAAALPADMDLTPDERVNIEVYEKANRAVVNITTKVRSEDFFSLNDIEQEGSGSGCVIDQEGHIITNNHVIEDSVRNRGSISVVLFDASTYEGEIVGTDPPNDLAVLKINAPRDKLFPLEMGDSSTLKVGLRAFVIGNPFGLERTLTTGVISSLNRSLNVSDVRIIKGIIQTDAAVNPGNSGGPLLDKRARLVGLNTAIIGSAKQSSGVGFAIPVNNIKRVVPQLIRYGRVIRADLGILEVWQVTGQGLILRKLAKGGAAAEAGLHGPRITSERRGIVERRILDPSKADMIIAIDGEKVTQFDELLATVENKKPGETVKLTYVRDREVHDAMVKLKASD